MRGQRLFLSLMKPSDIVLLVAESNLEVFQIDSALTQKGSKLHLKVARRFGEVTCVFQGIGIYEDREIYPLPSLILLDLRSGNDLRIVEWVRQVSPAPDTPIIGIGDFSEEGPIQGAFEAGINAYYDKREGFGDLAEVILSIEIVAENSSKDDLPRMFSKSMGVSTDQFICSPYFRNTSRKSSVVRK